MTLVLDAQALSVMARGLTGTGQRIGVLAALRAALEDGAELVVPAAVLAELYRGRQHDQTVDACLSRYQALVIVDTDRDLAREIGHLLARADRGSEDHVDATVVAVAARSGQAVIATGDVDDLSALAALLPGIRVAPV